ncbi:sugar phosphate nucleotidyltransferase [Nocardia wallacei]|uniref:sugar phosphate nucleotidyltransferase n=1 Tax=Nocardia wallacei TaxID=480035 RepID=UPI0024558191|nr:sugar phosphate nucleotidyltransferase [Nocardia wallacei]
MKGIVLAGGTGSRLAPLTRITNKHLLPIGNQPMIGYAIDALVHAGITQIMIVTGGTHAGEFIRLFGSGRDHGVLLTYAYQEKPGGIAEALSLTEHFAEADPIVVLLGDNIFEYSLAPSIEPFRRDPHGAMVVLAELQDQHHLQHLGVPTFDDHGTITRIIEKPADPPSHFAATGLYCYDNTVYDIIKTLTPSARGELEISDVNNHYIQRGQLKHAILHGFWGDAGESIDASYAVSDYVRQHGANKPRPFHTRKPEQPALTTTRNGQHA